VNYSFDHNCRIALQLSVQIFGDFLEGLHWVRGSQFTVRCSQPGHPIG
jgi:hypothetical protein